jgi:hypothetical protein
MYAYKYICIQGQIGTGREEAALWLKVFSNSHEIRYVYVYIYVYIYIYIYMAKSL